MIVGTQRGRAATKQLNKRQRRKRRRRRRPRLRCLRFLLFKLVCIGQGPAPDPRREACQGSHFEQEETEVTERPAAMPRCSLFPPFPHVQKSSRRAKKSGVSSTGSKGSPWADHDSRFWLQAV